MLIDVFNCFKVTGFGVPMGTQNLYLPSPFRWRNRLRRGEALRGLRGGGLRRCGRRQPTEGHQRLVLVARRWYPPLI